MKGGGLKEGVVEERGVEGEKGGLEEGEKGEKGKGEEREKGEEWKEEDWKNV